jgi:hypothetical protein
LFCAQFAGEVGDVIVSAILNADGFKNTLWTFSPFLWISNIRDGFVANGEVWQTQCVGESQHLVWCQWC